MRLFKDHHFVRITVLCLMLLLGTQVITAQTATDAAFQQFQGGYMIWRGDTGDIWVLWGEDNLFFSARFYPQSAYINLSDNPVSEIPPAGTIRPRNGFGRVWGNFDEVRIQLGWAIVPEVDYTATFAPTVPSAGGLKQTLVDFPNGREILIREDNSWGLPDEPRSIQSLPATTTFPASIQAFENGYMIWWSETGDIWSLAESNPARRYHSLSYGALPDNPITTKPPAGHIKPINGFGKVWGHFSAAHDTLGWAVDEELSYQMHFERGLGRITVSSPYGTFIISGETWTRIQPN